MVFIATFPHGGFTLRLSIAAMVADSATASRHGRGGCKDEKSCKAWLQADTWSGGFLKWYHQSSSIWGVP
jgi:hypothetical protein